MGDLIMTRHHDTGIVTIDHADPVIVISTQMLDDVRAGNTAPWATIDGNLLTFRGDNRTLVYRLSDEQPSLQEGMVTTALRVTELTDEESRALDLAADLANSLARIVGSGRTRSADLAELFAHVHAIQQAILAQVGARAYPDRFRLLGETLS